MSRAKLLDLERQNEIIDDIRQERLKTVLPQAMRDTGIDMWVILASECNEDPVYHTLVPAVSSMASRVTCLIFTIEKDGKEGAYSINKPNASLARFYEQLPYDNDKQLESIAAFIEEKNPDRIGINISPYSSLGAGLSKALYDLLYSHLSEKQQKKLIDADLLSTAWMEKRTEREIAMYPAVYAVTTEVMSRAFSREVVTPGITTTQEVECWCAQQYALMGLPTCFRPTVNLQRKGEKGTFVTGTIRHGDLLHYDAGIQYLGLCTDLQRLGYILKPGELDAPEGIKKGFERGHAFGKLVAAEFIEGRTGNEIFVKSMDAWKKAGLEAMLYTHPIGTHCHAAGPTIGLYDKQAPIPDRGDRALHLDTTYALEYNVTEPVLEWDNQRVVFYLEETVLYRQNGVLEYQDGDWHKLILI